jgi:hypothetical protein
MAAIATVALGTEIREQILKTAKPIFSTAGKLAEDFVKKVDTVIRDTLGHSHHTYAANVCGVDLVLDELATDIWGHRIRLTVLWSPEDKMNDKFYEGSGNSAAKARAQAMGCLQVLAKYYYGATEKKEEKKA